MMDISVVNSICILSLSIAMFIISVQMYKHLKWHEYRRLKGDE